MAMKSSVFDLYYKMFFYYCQNRLVKKIVETREKSPGPTHIMFIFADHFEPGDNPGRVEKWILEYKKQINGHCDSDGIPPQHTWFYPCEQLDFVNLKNLAKAAFHGLGEIELHLHHQNDSSESLTSTLKKGLADLSKVGAFINEDDPRPRFGFVHGNWSLDNSRGSSFCGVNDEISILGKLGCYGDFTFPSYENVSQPKKLNSIYYVIDDPEAPKSYNWGKDVCNWKKQHGDLLIMQGPWGYDWKRRKFGIFPYVECGEIAPYYPPAIRRIELWLHSRVHVLGCKNWRFIKIHTHGAHLRHMPFVLGNKMKEMYCSLESKYNDKKNYVLHYITAREAYNIIKAAEDGKNGNPNEFRDYIIPRPLNRKVFSNVLYNVTVINADTYTLSLREDKDVHLEFKNPVIKMHGDIKEVTCFKAEKRRITVIIRSNAKIVSNNELNIEGNFNYKEEKQFQNEYHYYLSN